MSTPRLLDLLSDWQRAYEQGHDLPPRELCPDQPDLADRLARCVEALRPTLPRNPTAPATLAPPEPAGPAALPGRAVEPPMLAPGTPAAGADGQATLPPAGPGAEATVPPGQGRVVPPPALAAHPAGYEVLGELGRGGMGVVYKARQAGLNRLVALKMILAGGHAGDDDRRRFLAEAEAIAAIKHPGIVQVFEFGTHAGLPFFALEFCEGGSLADKLAGNPLPPGEAARVVEGIARAMQAAHERGIVHRDLKPANVLLDGSGQVKVTDFGLAKKVEGSGGMTQTGAFMGTPSYVAPEQAEGKKGVGPAADVYALGAILYDCLTGRPPFRAATTFDTLMQVVGEEPVPPRQLNRTIPQDLETICLKCLEKIPGNRYPTAEELARDVQRYLNNEPIEARIAGLVKRFQLWCGRPQRVPEAGVALIFFTVVLLAWCVLYHTIDSLRHLADDWTNQQEWFRFLVVMTFCGAFQLPMLAVGWGTVRRKLPALLTGTFLAAIDLGYSTAGLLGFAFEPSNVFRTRECALLLYSLFVVLSCLWLAVYLIALKAYYHNRDTMRKRQAN